MERRRNAARESDPLYGPTPRLGSPALHERLGQAPPVQPGAVSEGAASDVQAAALRLRRVACVSLPELPLQLLLRRHPRWRGRPVALVFEERPEAPLEVINHAARQAGLRPGLRFGVAKSLVPELCAGAVHDLELEQALCELVQALQTFSPHVERDPGRPGVFYLDPSGLEGLYGDVACWARSVFRFVRGKGYVGSLVVGHGRTLSFAAAQCRRGVAVLDAARTLDAAHRVPLERLGMGPRVRDGLLRLGLLHLGDLARFGPDALRMRFGGEAAAWCRVARGDEMLPLLAEPHAEALRVSVPVEPAADDVARLCFALERGLDALLPQLLSRGEGAAVLWLTLKLERGGRHRERLEPARTSRDAGLWLELLRLRLSSVALEGPVEEVQIEVEGVRLVPGQMALFATGRDPSAGDRALARLRALFGEHSVRRAQLREGHLPEASFRWEPVTQLSQAAPKAPDPAAPPPLVRRLLRRPEPLSASLQASPAGQARPFAAQLRVGDEVWRLTGPYRLSGAWWVREVTRDYYYAESGTGELRWVFYDRARQAWFVHARVG